MEKESIVRISLRLNENKARALKILAAYENKKVHAVLVDLVDKYISENKSKIILIDN